MKASNPLWTQVLANRLPDGLAEEIQQFEDQIILKKQGRLDDKVFMEARLRRGCYGQRYDNGQRHDGVRVRSLRYPCGDLTKGVNTVWDAPGMQRIKIPCGGLNARQLEVIAELAEEYSDGVAHVTTRQDFQLHFVHLDDTPTIMRRLAAVGITTREACGNTVRNVTACSMAGICPDEIFDVTPYARACAYFLLGHPDCQSFGRKFKIAFSGCPDKPCGLARIHDIGLIARVRLLDGSIERGFEVLVGGGLGPVPYQAKLFSEFLPVKELLPTVQAIARVFARLGEKRNRNRARMKFLVDKLGIEEFKRLVQEERAALPEDPAWASSFEKYARYEESPPNAPADPAVSAVPEPDSRYQAWLSRNVQRQRQPGFVAVTIPLPLGDITSEQLRQLADIVRRYTPDTIRTTIEQNFLLRWVRESDLPALYQDLDRACLAEPLARTIADITACPGTDTCKLGIASSRGLARELRRRLAAKLDSLDPSLAGLRVKISGCFNSCGQHHVADIGFYGVSRNRSGYTVPHFQLLLGGNSRLNACSYGLPIAAIPSKRVPEALERILACFQAERQPGEDFHAFVRRKGKESLKALIEDLTQVPPHDAEPSYYVDWSDAREFSTEDIGVGECAGEVVTPLEFELASCERDLLAAQALFEKGATGEARQSACHSMIRGARALLDWLGVTARDDEEVVARFKTELCDTQLFHDPFVGGTFANYFLTAWEQRREPADQDTVRRLLNEAQLFLDACHACYARITAARSAKRREVTP